MDPSLRPSEPGRSPILGSLERPLVLVGLMGAGKSSIGRRLARAIGVEFVDADTVIEEAAGMPISDIFAQFGEPHFREKERQIIARLLDAAPKVLATGGGAFFDPNTRKLVKERAISVWLKADLETLVHRCARRNNRPLLQGRDLRETLSALMEKRYPIYAEADVTVTSGNDDHRVVVDAIVAKLGLKSLLAPEIAS